MEPNSDPYEQYQDLLIKAFEKIKKLAPKKYKEMRDECTEAIEKVKTEQKGPYNANQYFYILKMALDTKITKLMEHILYILQKLVSYEFLDGNCEDNCIYTEENKPNQMNGRLKRRLIDSIVESICSCVSERDNQVQLQIIKSLLTIVTTFNSKVHEKSLLEAFRAIYQIHITSTNSINQNTAKASLTQMINIVFSKMEAYAQSHGLNLARVRSEAESEEEEGKTPSSASGRGTRKGSESQELGEQEVRVNFKALDQYVYSVTQNLVDDVCLHEARVRAIGEKYYELEQNCVEREDQERLNQEKEEEIMRIPLRSVGIGSTKEDNPNRVPVEILNEAGNISGKFGWCICCRGKANLFCKDTRHPVCSFDCKQKHLGLIDSIESERNNKNAVNFYSSEEARRYFTDAVIVFKSICKLCLKEIPSSNVNTFTIRSKVLGLELILAVVEKPGTLFLTRKEFVDIVKHTLCSGLIKYCVSQEKQIFALSTSIFYFLFLHFREHLKSEIYVFIQTIFIKILDSGNSNYHHKYLILEVFAKLAESIKHMLEIFLNYDCQQGNEDIFSRMMDSLAKIAQGKFSKSEHSYIITPAEELSLRLYALQIMVTHLRGMNKTIEAETAEERLATRNSLANKNSTVADNTSNEGDEESSQKENVGSFDSASFYSQQQPDNYEKTRALKNEINKASFKFNMKPKNGIAYMQQKGLICKEPKEQMVKEIVAFLKGTPQLDKTVIGDYMGEITEVNKLVLYSFIDDIDFKNVSFVDSLRLLLQGFRLPGEGQKVDRIMEKFGEKFVHDNPDQFASAESVYLLSYATIMAHTSIHNPQAQKNFMTLEDYTKMLRGIDGGKNLDPEFISSIYKTIEAEPFTLDEDEDLRVKLLGQNANSRLKKNETYIQEADMLAKRGKAHISSKTGNPKDQTDQFILVTETEHIKTMFEDTWSANLAVFSVLLEESDDERITQLCLEGFLHAIKVSGYYRMPTERDAFVSSLSKFTQISTLKEIKDKNLDCVTGLIQLAVYDGNFLGNSWYYVLDCISKVDYMHVLGTGARKDSEFFNAQKGSRLNKAKAQKEQAMAQKSEIIASAIDPNKIDLIIQKSVNLDGDAVVDFISNLCRVSSEELDDEENPRKFSLQRLVEVADFNMDNRIRFTWNKIWSMLSDHFSAVGSHPNLHVALYSIDSLRQLADKFLLKEEFANYHFQKDFLKPFETIMLNNLHTRYDIKEYIVMCIANMCVSKTNSLKSGWVVIINIFTLAAQDLEERLVKQSFEALKHSIQSNSNLVEENFIELINCLGKFSKNQFEQQAIEALQCIEHCAKELTNKPDLFGRFIQHNGVQYLNQEKESLMRQIQNHSNVEEAQEKLKKLNEAQKDGKTDQRVIQFVVLKALWFPILNNLTNIFMEKRERMQQRARDLLFVILQDNLRTWPLEFWLEILQQILIPMLDDIQLAVDIPGRNIDYDFYRQTTKDILHSFVTFFNKNVAKLEQIVPSFVQTLCHFIKEIKEKVIAQAGVDSLKHFLQQSGDQLSPDSWDQISEHICELFDATTPRQLTQQDKGDNQDNMNEDSCYTQCIIQLLLIQCVQEITSLFFGHISEQNLDSFLSALDKSHKFAQNFNQDHQQRFILWKKGFMSELERLPGLIRQEWESLSATLRILFRLFHQPKESRQDPERLFGLCEGVIKSYAHKCKELQLLVDQKMEEEEQEEEKGGIPKKSEQEIQKIELEEDELERQLANLRPIVAEIILPEIESLKQEELMKLVKTLCPQLIELTLCESLEIREANASLLTKIFNDLQQKAGVK